MKNKVDNFIDLLANFNKDDIKNTFNPWKEIDSNFDREDANKIRRNNLKKYLLSKENATVIFIGEAPGFNGCRFCGVPFLDEQILLNKDPLIYKQSSKPSLKAYSEKTATILKSNTNLENNYYKWVTWNIFPFHPYKKDNVNKNRKPLVSEINKTLDILKCFLALFPKAQVYSIGRTSEKYIKTHFENIKTEYIRHPSYGGANDFNNFCNRLKF